MNDPSLDSPGNFWLESDIFQIIVLDIQFESIFFEREIQKSSSKTKKGIKKNAEIVLAYFSHNFIFIFSIEEMGKLCQKYQSCLETIRNLWFHIDKGGVGLGDSSQASLSWGIEGGY